jgi:hypothetical protein
VLLVEQQEAIWQPTVGQHTNPNWHTMRRGRLTASNYGAVGRANRVTLSLLKKGTQITVVRLGVVCSGAQIAEEGIKAFKIGGLTQPP